ncbi:kinase-like domain-containing protein [Podospora fimiseda]|uniref:Kinase-like domain-containing protein n=1 Tax=Podospora fimiseda TaxID=252190 RepID=A0AAN7H1V4_9PEZI|nr:kinase-like domain-containing protein [Podospora fimiseda]
MDLAAEKVKAALANTHYVCSSLHPLSGGAANFTFKGRLLTALPDGTEEVAIKHGENFLASNPSSGWELPMFRCKVEEECLKDLGGMPTPPWAPCVVRTPKIYHFNHETNTKVIEYLDSALSLKDYALKHFVTPDPSRKPFCLDVGKSLGIWLRTFHDWGNKPEQSRLQNVLKQDNCLQTLRHRVYYSALVGDVKRFPDILSDAKEVFEQVEKTAAEELKREDLVVIHGDFWTGNSLLKDQVPQDGLKPDIFIVDWEMAQYGVRPVDLGQMIAECYELLLFKNIEDGKWLVEGFVEGYGPIDEEFAFRALINVGIHLVIWGSRVAGWGTPEQVQEVVGKGKEIIVHAWNKDRVWFEAGDLACLFGKP